MDIFDMLKRWWFGVGPVDELNTLNFTPRAQELLGLARKEGDRLQHSFIGSEHLLLGLVKLGRGVAVNVLDKRGIKLEGLREEIEKFSLPGRRLRLDDIVPFTPCAMRALSHAQQEARALKHTYVGTEHILLGLLHEDTGVASKLLANLGVEARQVREEILKELDPDANP